MDTILALVLLACNGGEPDGENKRSHNMTTTPGDDDDDTSFVGDDDDDDTDILELPSEVSLINFDGGVQKNLPFVAFQDGDGSWQEVAGQGGRYTFPITGERYGIAWVCVDLWHFTRIFLRQVSAKEIADNTISCRESPPSGQILGTALGLSGGESANIAAPGAIWTARSGAPSYQLNVLPGPTEIIAARYDGTAVDRLLFQRGLWVSEGASLSLDVNLSLGFAPEVHTSTVDGAQPGENSGSYTYFRTALGSYLSFAFDQRVPASELTEGDLHIMTAYSSGELLRRSAAFQHEPAPVALVLPDPQPAPEVSAVVDPYVRLSVAFTPSEGIDVYQVTSMTYPSAETFFTGHVTAGWLAAGGPPIVEVPALAELPGWDPAWDLEPGSVYSWYYGTVSGSAEVDLMLGQLVYAPIDEALDGKTIDLVERSGLIEP